MKQYKITVIAFDSVPVEDFADGLRVMIARGATFLVAKDTENPDSTRVIANQVIVEELDAEPDEPDEPNESTWAARIKSILGWRIRLEGSTGVIDNVAGTVGDRGEPLLMVVFEDGAKRRLTYSEIMRECVLIEPPGGPVNWEQYPTTHPHKPGATY